MKAVLHILVSEELSDLLNTREAATELINSIRKNPCSIVELDFSNVEFMSRSFADQLYKEQQEVQKELKVVIHIVNANEEIINMLRAVKLTQNIVNRAYTQIPVYKYTDASMLRNYLLSV
ncbi:MAG: DUF4325 domain-containing protein [Bacteroidetes bacterium]|nr:DUF4325 domain-containing protein [Bacteroidota bacterium]